MSKAESERQTRKERVDPRLRQAGWTIVPFTESRQLAAYRAHAVEEYPTDNGPADYALFVDGQLLGVAEAKKLTLGPAGVLIQAERYARGVNSGPFDFRGLRVPFLYSTNGEVIWFYDARSELNRSREIAAFHSPDGLRQLLSQNSAEQCQWFARTPNNHPRLRPYQIEANAEVEKAIANAKREMLVAMATGTGKTFTMVNQVYRLMKSAVGKRILFLVDRRVLAAQAVRAFASFEPEPGLKFDKIYEVYSQRFQKDDFDEDEKFDPSMMPNGYLTNPKAGHAFVYVCTIQRMAINLLGRKAIFDLEDREAVEDDADQLDIPIHAFDVIIADECHRGYTTAAQSAWREVLDHFDAIKIGLTATPAAHTKAYFKDVVFRYEYERAVGEGHLVDYDAVAVKSNVRMNGLFLNEGEEVSMVDPESGAKQRDLLEDERQFAVPEVEQRVTSPDSNRKILEELKKYAEVHEQQYGRFPKTLIFAHNDVPHTSHADQLVDLAREIVNRGEAFVRKVTGKVDRPLKQIREFRNRKEPGIVVTVDLLTTGVDIPDLEFIVFLRPVRSRILFEQMLGRGTRKGEHYPDKSHFTVFDCFDGTLLAYFRKSTGITAEPPDKPVRTLQQVIDDIWQNRDRDYNIRCLIKRLQRIEKEMSAEARDLFAGYGIANGDMGRYARELPGRLKHDFTEAMRLLREPNFQELLITYPRRRDAFLIAIESEDVVSSEYFIRDGVGKEYKPQDYLLAFAEFVDKNKSQIDAISILLGRPTEWSTDALTQLRDKLAQAPQHFTLKNLQKAHERHYKKALVEIISMVKHAADEQQPLLTADERVARAFQSVIAGRDFNAEQRQWLDRIRHHLNANLSIDQDDFDAVPVLEQAGGWSRANRVFDGQLTAVIAAINSALAA